MKAPLESKLHNVIFIGTNVLVEPIQKKIITCSNLTAFPTAIVAAKVNTNIKTIAKFIFILHLSIFWEGRKIISI